MEIPKELQALIDALPENSYAVVVELSVVRGYADEWTRMVRLHARVKADWHKLDQFRAGRAAREFRRRHAEFEKSVPALMEGGAS